jgi:Iron-containing redox enzyme
MTTSRVQELYMPHVRAARERLATDRRLRALLDPGTEARVLERFLSVFSSRGVQMTRPVEGWIKRAGERCAQIPGLEDVARSLIAHARHEAGHELMMIDDTRHLVSRWNARRSPRLDADALLAQPPTPAMVAYVKLHEDIIASASPYRQTGVELEIEAMSPQLGPAIVERCKEKLGADIMSGLSFIAEHAALDIGHTHANTRLLDQLLAIRPDAGREAGEAGAAGLGIYLDFLGECYDAARAEVAEA